MNAKIRIASVVVAGLVLFGCAATSQNVNSKPAPSAALKNSTCLADTGSRVSTGMDCRAYGRTYSSGDIGKTGSTDVGSALALLDPSITVHR